jgi:poly-gamma-glutamate synthesis protein (capsule biosynthesis protein)
VLLPKKFSLNIFVFVQVLCLFGLLSLAACTSRQLVSLQDSTLANQITSVPLVTSAPTKSLRPASTLPPIQTATSKPAPITQMVFTGVIVPARCVQAAVAERGQADFIYDGVRDILSEADIAVGVLNAAITDTPPQTGCVPTFVLVGSSNNADAIANAGFDLINVATNHIKNCGLTSCGDQGFFDTLANLDRVGLLHIGAGANLAEALQTRIIEINGIRFGFVAQGEIEQQAYAGETTPGIGVLTEEHLRAAIAELRPLADVVIVMPHSGPEDSVNPNPFQQKWARIAVESGADLVVMNHTHVVQAYQQIDGVMVFYSLGNFVFDQTWSREHMQGMILRVTFEGSTLLSWELLPTITSGDGSVSLADPVEAQQIIDRIQAASERLPD